jgi:hypothetical protein
MTHRLLSKRSQELNLSPFCTHADVGGNHLRLSPRARNRRGRKDDPGRRPHESMSSGKNVSYVSKPEEKRGRIWSRENGAEKSLLKPRLRRTICAHAERQSGKKQMGKSVFRKIPREVKTKERGKDLPHG